MTMYTFLSSLEGQDNASEAFCEYVVDRLELCVRSVASIISLLAASGASSDTGRLYATLLSELLGCLRSLYSQWSAYLDRGINATSGMSYRAPITHTGNVGRPRFLVTQHQLQYLRSMSFTWVQISQILSISMMTLYRRRQEYGMLREPNETLTDSELHSLILHLQSDMPALGQTMVWGRIRAMGFSVTRERIRRALRAIDPIETALRWRGQQVHRQPYCVPGPNSLWHLGKKYFYAIHSF